MSEETTEKGQVSSINEETNTMPPHINMGDVTVREISEGTSGDIDEMLPNGCSRQREPAEIREHLSISGDSLSDGITHYADPHTLKRLLELEKDKERLDWLELNYDFPYRETCNVYVSVGYGDGDGEWWPQTGQWRMAIDEAMEESK